MDPLVYCRKHMTTVEWQRFLDSDDYLWLQVERKGFYCPEMDELIRRDIAKYEDSRNVEANRPTEGTGETTEDLKSAENILRCVDRRVHKVLQRIKSDKPWQETEEAVPSERRR